MLDAIVLCLGALSEIQWAMFPSEQFLLINIDTPQRIECWWSRLRAFKTSWWIDLFSSQDGHEGRGSRVMGHGIVI